MWITPVVGRISSPFNPNRKHPKTKKLQPHGGTDIAVPVGTLVLAASDGVVSETGSGGAAGVYLRIDHGGGIVTSYHHLSSRIVTKGVKVKSGEAIARSGNTGTTTGPHLHFEVRQNGVKIDAEPFLRARGAILGSKERLTTGGFDVAQMPTLKRGDRGYHVGLAQQALLGLGFKIGTEHPDESWGPGTDAGFAAFQKKYPKTGTNGKPDAKCGPASWTVLLTGKA